MSKVTSREMDFQSAHWQALAALWRQQMLCDVQLKSLCGERLAAHGIVLASASGFFRALLCGAGRSMREGCRMCDSSQSSGTAATTGAAGAAAGSLHGYPHATSAGPLVVELPYSTHQLSVLLEVLYEHTIDVCAMNVTWLLDMAAYLEVQPLQEACCEFLRSALSPETCVDVLLLSHHYHCTSLEAEGVQYLAQRLSSLLLVPETRKGLTQLPEPLLLQLLCNGALEVEQENELLCFLADWVCWSPQHRQHHLPNLLRQLQLSVLTQEQLSQQQLQSCSCPAAAALAKQLHEATQNCHQASLQHCMAQDVQRHFPPAPPQPKQQQLQQQQRQDQGQHRPGGSQFHLEVDVVSSSSSAVHDQWWLGPTADANNHSPSGADNTSSTDISPIIHAAAMASLQSPGHNNRSPCSAHPAGSASPHRPWIDDCATMAAAAAVQAAGCASVSSSGACSSSSSSSSAASVLDLCWDSRRIGAVVLEAWPGKQRGYLATSLMVAGGHDPSWRGLKSVEVYDPRRDAWWAGPALPAALPFAGAGLPTRGQLYVIGGAMYSSNMARLDVANDEWHACDGPRLSRLHAGVTGASGLLFVTGGRTQVNQVVAAVEAYDHEKSCWQSLPDMLQPRYAHAVVSQGGCLYALGGQASKTIHRTVEVFDAQRGSWQPLGAELTCDRKYCAAASLGGRLMVVGGMNEARCRLSSVEAFDPREGRWINLTSMQHPRSSCSVAGLCGRLYVMGGNAGDQQLHGSVEEFDPAAGRWRSCAPMSCGRSGLTAAAV